MEPKEDDDISIDFGKIKSFFKRDRKEGDKKEETKAEDKAEESKVESNSAELNRAGSSPQKEQKEEGKEERKENYGGEREEDDISIDFGKLKNLKSLFKSSEHSEHSGHEHAKTDEELSINWNKVYDFFKRYGVVFIALIPIILSIYIRVQSGSLLFADDWAANSVIGNIRSQIRGGIDGQYPNLPDANKNAIVETELQKALSQNSRQIDERVKATSSYIKSFFQDEGGRNYMTDIDPYYWFRYAKNIVEHGHPGDILKDGKPFDTYQLAPIGRFVVPDQFHPYFLAYFYRFLHFFMPGLTLMRSMFYYPVFVSALSVLLVFLIARKIAGNAGGFFAGLMMAVNPAFLSRTLSPDNDAWNIFFSLIITWLILEALEEKKIVKIMLLTIAGGFFTGLFTLEWSGWWFIFDFLLATIGLTFLYLAAANFGEIRKNVKLLFSKTNIRNVLIIGAVYFISTAAFVTLFSGWGQFRSSFIGPLSFPSIKAPVSPSLWPNVLTTVAELNEGSIDGIINSVGGRFLFFISLIGLILAVSRKDGIKNFDVVYIIASGIFYAALFVRIGNAPALYQQMSMLTLLALIILPVVVRIFISVYKKDFSYDFKLSILLSLWVVSAIFASIKGIRFTVLLSPAFSVAFGVAFGSIYFYVPKLLSKELKIPKWIGGTVLLVLLLPVYITPTSGSIKSARNNIPIINDAWYNALNAIKQDSGKDAIITSWWDFGHHFKALADRRVTFDGTTQTSPAAHWVGKLLMTNDEQEAVGILRMLNCGHNNAHNELFKVNANAHKSLKLLNEILVLDKKNAREKLLEDGLSAQQAESVLQYTHCTPPDAYFIASEDMIGKSGVWGHFGSWNLERADIWQNARKLPEEQAVEYMIANFNYTRERAEKIYSEIQSITSDSQANAWVAPWPGYGGTVGCSKKDKSDATNSDIANKSSKAIYVCSNGFQISMGEHGEHGEHDISATGQQGIVRPKVAAFATKEGLYIKEFNGTTVDFGMTIIPKGDSELEAVLSSKELTGSIFTRMFYMSGHGLRYFKLFNHQRGLTGTDIYTYKVDWEGKNVTISI